MIIGPLYGLFYVKCTFDFLRKKKMILRRLKNVHMYRNNNYHNICSFFAGKHPDIGVTVSLWNFPSEHKDFSITLNGIGKSSSFNSLIESRTLCSENEQYVNYLQNIRYKRIVRANNCGKWFRFFFTMKTIQFALQANSRHKKLMYS